MKKILLTLILGLQLSLFVSAQINYPITRKVNQVDTVFKHILYDPYRWLENIKSNEVVDWFKEQQKYTNNTLQNLTGVDSFINQLNNYNTQKTWFRFPNFKAGKRYYYTKGGRNQLNIPIYYRQENDTTEHFLFDTWSIHPGTRYHLATQKISPNNQYLLVALDVNGEEYPHVKIYDTQSNTWLKDSIPHCYETSISWQADSKGFIYDMNESDNRFAPENINKEVIKYHHVNTLFKDDIIILDSTLRNKVEPKISDSYYANMFTANSKNRIYCQPNMGFEYEYSNMYYANTTQLKNIHPEWSLLFSNKDSILMFNLSTSFIESENGYYFISNKGKGFKSLRKTNTVNPNFSNAKIVLPEDNIWQLENIQQTKSYILAAYSKYGFLDKVIIIDKKTDKIIKVKSIENNDKYLISTMGEQTDECLFSLYPVNRPRRSFILNIKKDTLINDSFWVIKNQVLLTGWENIVSEIIEVPSYDGTLVPMSIMRDKDTKLDGNNICFLYGYGAYGIGTKDNSFNQYSPVNNLLIERGVILAHAYVRGGGEKGENWHLAATKTNKPNTWKDFIACADFLVKNKYTQPSKFACTGGSAGGILIGRTITERPDLFAAAHIQSGSLNNSRIAATANGIGNYSEYGNPNIEKEFDGLLEEDATCHVKPNIKYPALYVTTGINDSRVAPWIPAKFVATMQANSVSNKPVLLHTNFEGGHFGDANASSVISLIKTQFTAEFFMLWQCGHKDFTMK
jgi:prolyl oligopeptidase